MAFTSLNYFFSTVGNHAFSVISFLSACLISEVHMWKWDLDLSRQNSGGTTQGLVQYNSGAGEQ